MPYGTRLFHMYGRMDGREGKKEGVVVRFLGEEGSTVLWIGYGMGWDGMDGRMDGWMGGLKLGWAGQVVISVLLEAIMCR